MKNYPQKLRVIYNGKIITAFLEDLIVNPNKDFRKAISKGTHICYSLGVLDKKKTEVFECDIVRVPGNWASPAEITTVVERCNSIGGGFICTGLAYISSSIVIGNRHSNPELIKKLNKWI